MAITADKADSAAPAVRAYRFADCRLLASRRILERAGTELPLTTKLYHLLLAFLEHPGEVLGKEAIVAAVWPRQIVTDAALAKQVQRLRQTLGDGDRDPPLLETHRGLGYRLTCPVTVEYYDDRPTRVAPSPRPRRPTALAAALCVGVGIALVTLVTGREAEVPTAAPPLALLPVTTAGSALSEGAAEYLARRLGGDAAIAPTLELPGTAEDALQRGSLRLAEGRHGPVAALQLERSEAGYRLWINQRNGEQVAAVVLSDAAIAPLLERGAAWLHGGGRGEPAGEPPTGNPFALASYFEGLAASQGGRCDGAADYYRAALASDAGFERAQLRLARCERQRGQAHTAAAMASALLAGDTRTEVALEARLLAARAHLELGDSPSAREHLEAARELAANAVLPLQRLRALSALALLAELDGDGAGARILREERLTLAEREYPLPGYLAELQLDLAASALAAGDHDALREHANAARSLAEEHGDLEALLRSYRYLVASYYRDNDMDAAVQLALAARPILDRVDSAEAEGFFLQFATLALNLRGRFEEARDYTAALRTLGEHTANPMFGAIADLTVMHRRYVQGDYKAARALAAGTRQRLEADNGFHAAIPTALSFEAIAAARGAPVAEATTVIESLEQRYGNVEALRAPVLRARGHLLARSGSKDRGLALLREAEAAYRAAGARSVADYTGYEIAELRLKTESTPPWDDLERLSAGDTFDYKLAMLQARAYAREDNHLAATAALEEARLRGNDLWSERDQLLLERYRSVLAMADAGGAETAGTLAGDR